MQLQTKLNWKHLHVGRVTQDIFFPFSCSMTPKRLRWPFCSFCPSAHRQIMCVGLLAFVSKKFEPTWETITFSVEIVEGNGGDLLALAMEICCSGVYTFLVTLVSEQVQCPESMNRNTFPCFHPDPEPYSPQPLLSHTHKGSTLQSPELNLLHLQEADGVCGPLEVP